MALKSRTFRDPSLVEFSLRGLLRDDGTIDFTDLESYLRLNYSFHLRRRDLIYAGDGYIRVVWEEPFRE